MSNVLELESMGLVRELDVEMRMWESQGCLLHPKSPRQFEFNMPKLSASCKLT